MQTVIHYELDILRRRWYIVVLFLTVLVVLLLFLAFIPNTGNVLGSLGYPEGENRASVLLTYEQELSSIEQGIANGALEEGDYRGTLRALHFFLSTKTCEYDYISYQELFSLHQGAEQMAYGLSFLEGAAFVNILIAVFLSDILFSFPIEKSHVKMMVEAGISRKNIFWGKMLIGYTLILLFSLIAGVIGFIVISPKALSQVALIVYHNTFIGIPLWNIVLSRTLSFIFSGCFFFSLSTLIGLFSKKTLLATTIPLFLFVLCFLCSNATAPSWGDYGQLSGVSGWLLVFVPFSNIVITPSFGLVTEVGLLLGSYAILDTLLFYLTKRKFWRTGL